MTLDKSPEDATLNWAVRISKAFPKRQGGVLGLAKHWKQCQTLFFLQGAGGKGGSKINADGDCSHETKRHLLLGRKVMTNLDSILKNIYITLPTKVRLVKAMVFPVVMYGCESWTL